MKCVPVHHGIPAVLHRDEPWLHRHSENGALSCHLSLRSLFCLFSSDRFTQVLLYINSRVFILSYKMYQWIELKGLELQNLDNTKSEQLDPNYSK